MKKEFWKDIEGYEGYYQVSSCGRVKSLAKLTKSKNGSFCKRKEFIMTEKINKLGYSYQILSRENKRQSVLVHRLVALAFLDKIINKNFVNHKNGFKADNYYKNLEWVTRQENSKHAADNGLYKKGIYNHRSKLCEKDIVKIREMRLRGLKLNEIARKYNISDVCVSHICLKKTWKHVE